MTDLVVVVTAEWDLFRGDAERLCDELSRRHVKCIVKYIDGNVDEETAELLTRYCVRDGMIKIPQVVVFVRNKVVVLDKIDVNQVLQHLQRL